MEEKDVIRQFKRLKDIQPNKEWAVLARQNLLNHIEYEEKTRGLLNLRVPAYLKLAATGAFALVAVLSAGFVLNQPKTVNIQSEYVLSAQDRVNEAKQLALSKLEAAEAQKVSDKLDNITLALEKDDSTANGPEEKEMVEKKANEVGENAKVLTNIFSSSEDPVADLRASVEERLASCQDEKLATEISELLETGELPDLLDGHFAASACLLDEPPALPAR